MSSSIDKYFEGLDDDYDDIAPVEEILPIDQFKDIILDSVFKHPVTLIVGETGSGKSTRVPQFIANRGHTCLVTQPRRMAAITVASRVADEMCVELGNFVGYATGYGSNYNASTGVLFCTDGIGVVREYFNTNKYEFLVIDEVHEYNLNIEMLLAWVKSVLIEESRHVVLMSATVDVLKYKRFFGDNLNIIYVNGRAYPVYKIETTDYDLQLIDKYVIGKKHNALYFLPGKKEILDVENMLKNNKRDKDMVIMKLHGELPYEEQKACFATYNKPKLILTTNVAQTSITIPDIDMVIDSENERRKELNNGVETLVLGRISYADVKQRMGRAGRTKPGIYVSVYEGDEEQTTYAIPEINRSHLDHVYLKIKAAGLDPDKVTFLHMPHKEDWLAAKRILIKLGCLDKRTGDITDLGNVLVSCPFSTRYGKMLYVANELGVYEHVLKIVAALNSGIRLKKNEFTYRIGSFQSDYHAYHEVETFINYIDSIENYEQRKVIMKKCGFNYRSIRNYQELMHKCKNMSILKDVVYDELRENDEWCDISDRVEHSILSGFIDQIYCEIKSNSYFEYNAEIPSKMTAGELIEYIETNGRQVDRNSFTAVGAYQLFMERIVVGIPNDFTINTIRGERMMHLITFVNCISDKWLDWFPDIFRKHLVIDKSNFTINKCVYYWDDIDFNAYTLSKRVFRFSELIQLPTDIDQRMHCLERIKDNLDFYFNVKESQDLLTEIKDCMNDYVKQVVDEFKKNNKNCTLYNPWTREKFSYVAEVTDTIVKDSNLMYNDTPDYLINKNASYFNTNKNKYNNNKKISDKDPKEEEYKKWIILGNGKFIKCLNGHTTHISKARKADPVLYTCPICGKTAPIHKVR